jgi:prepilin-type N-terminal cleavage/methylation domain-containing protein/prepilin-type processing-associated H-X9-DG protein
MKKGFTLIELLVVIAIIAILAAILFPVFAKAREKARQSSCQSNLKQIALSMLQYVQDYDEMFPCTWYTSGGINYNYLAMIQPYVKNTQLFRCPSDSAVIVAGWAATDPNRYATSYGFNFLLNGVALARVASSSTTLMNADLGANYDANGIVSPVVAQEGSWILVDYANHAAPDGNWAAPNPRHNDMANFNFVDGHVKTLKVNSVYYNNSPWLYPAIGGS